MVHHHRFLLVTFPAQGHINPTLQFAKTLTRMGVHDVTLFTTVHMLRRMSKSTTVSCLSFATFSDGFDDGFHSSGTSIEVYLSELRRLGSEALANYIISSGAGERPFTCVVHTMLLPWAEEVARGLHVPTALLWPQPATVFDIYYYYFKDDDYIKNRVNREDPSCLIQLPGLPPFETQDLPSFLTSSGENDVYSFILPSFKEQFRVIQQEPKYTILVNTFEELEAEALKSVVDSNINMISIGPLIPSAFIDGVDPSDTSFGGDLFDAKSNDEYMEWLESKAESSVVYVSFGSISVLSKRQMEEIAGALLECGYPFLWVIREKDQKKGEGEQEEAEEMLSGEYREELRKKGKIVGWCKQVEVLSHGSVGCFVTHCGWNSSLESLSCGVPVVAVPQWTDQNTNAKLLEDVWKTGVRANKTSVEEGVVVERDEIRRCLDVVMASGDLRNNAKKWKDLASKAVNPRGSSHINLTTFLRNLPSPN